MKPAFSKDRPIGESFVWFTSMGLAIGLIMVVFLLFLIISNGIKVFWPDETAVIKLKDGTSIAGNILRKQERMGSRGSASVQHEMQLFIGNKDIYGLRFKFIDEKDVVETKYPKEIMEIERLEYGDAIVLPKTLDIKGNQSITSSDPQFNNKLESEVKEVRARWKEIKHIEKDQIGSINREMEDLRIKQKVAQQKKKGTEHIKEIEGRMAKLQADYEVLAAKASELRSKQAEDHLKYILVSGEEKDLPTGQIVSYFYPNQMNGLQR